MMNPLLLANLMLAYRFGWPLVASRTLPALAITLAFSLIAWGMRGVTVSGALAGAVVTFVICVAAGPGGFAVVLTVFLLTMFATRFGLHRKQAAGVAERKDGRHANQIFANLGAATIAAAPCVFFHHGSALLFAAMTAALCEAAADTVSSEVGQATGRRAYLITTLRSVPAGTDGGISIAGTATGIMAAFIVAVVAMYMDIVRSDWAIIAALAGIIGMLFDSVLGATLERPGKLGNDSVNFISSTFAASLALLVGIWFMA